MDIGAIHNTQPIAPVANAQANGQAIASAQGINTVRVEAPPPARAAKDTNNNSASDKRAAEQVAGQTQKHAAEAQAIANAKQGFVFSPETANIVFRVQDEFGKTILQSPSETELARRVYEKKAEHASVQTPPKKTDTFA